MTNPEALGYMMLACKRLGLLVDEADAIHKEMYFMFDMKTEKEAMEQGSTCYNKERTDKYK